MGLGTWVQLSTTFHGQIYYQVEWTIQNLEDMLRVSVIDFKGYWDVHLTLIEFPYNNSYHLSNQMAPFEAFNCRRCIFSIGWFEVGLFALIGLEFVCEAMEKVWLIWERVKNT